jgi:L-threonylcarbamoyladenylate synthase
MGRLGKPVLSTSVNRSGEESLTRVRDMIERFGAEVDCIVDGGDFTGGKPSTLVAVSASPYRVLRQGSLLVPEDCLI